MPSPRAASRIRSLLVLAVAVAAVSFNLRPLVTSTPPIFGELRQQYGFSEAELAVLAAIPVACFGLFSAAAIPLCRRARQEAVIAVVLAVLVAGALARGMSGALVFLGTAVSAAAIAILNVLIISLIRRRWPQRTGVLLGVYLTWLYLGAAAGSAVSAPLYYWSSSLPVTLGIWALPAAVALVIWLPQLRRGAVRRISDPYQGWWILRHRLAWQVTAFMGLQSAVYYAAVSWLPTILRDRGVPSTDAGYLTSLLSIAGLGTAWVFPVLAERAGNRKVLVALTVLLTTSGIAGVAFAPPVTAAFWCLVLGLALGGTLALATYLAVARAVDAETAAVLTAVSQALGYLLALVGPLVVGLLYSATDHWLAPVLLLLSATVLELVVGVSIAEMPRRIGGTSACQSSADRG